MSLGIEGTNSASANNTPMEVFNSSEVGLGLALKKSTIVIASARQFGVTAKELIGRKELNLLSDNAVVLDLVRTEGGSVVFSENDTTLIYSKTKGNVIGRMQIDKDGKIVSNSMEIEEEEAVSYKDDEHELVYIHNVTGYPKRVPEESAKEYSPGMAYWLTYLIDKMKE